MQVGIPEPWQSFLSDVDQKLQERTKVHCLGGFVLAVLWDLPRPTGDLDFIEIEPPRANAELLKIAGEGSDLDDQYHLKFQRVSITDHPEGYASRLIDITPRTFRSLQLMAFEVHDLVLAKIARFAPRDRQDIAFLIRKGALDRGLLERRYEEELRPYALNETRYADNLKLCLGELFHAERR
jgi:Nucleotidyltransferase of unknown function (DUF6036)